MSKIRVKLDLSHFYVDKRRFAYVLIDPQCKKVKCLQRHVEKLFNLCNVEFVTKDSCYLPPQEDIDVVNSGDVLRVTEVEAENGVQNVLAPADTEIMPRARKKNKIKMAEECNYEVPSSFEPEVKPEQKEKKVRKRKYPAENEACAANDNVVTDAVLSVKKLKNIFDQKFAECDSHLSNISWQEKAKNTTRESTALNCISEDGETAAKPKRKRKRKKKSKHTSEVVADDSFKISLSNKNECFQSTPIIKQSQGGHIRFDDEGKTATNDQEGDSEKTSIVFTSYLSNFNSSKARIITGTVINNSLNQNGVQDHREELNCKETVHELSTENGTVMQNIEPTPPSNGVLSVGDNPHMEELTTQISNQTVAVSKIQNVTFSTKNILNLSEPLLSEPSIGDILIFKIYRLNECSVPSLSDFICGKLEGIDAYSKLMKIFLIDGQDQLLDSTGKCFMNLDMRGPDYLYLKYEDLIDRKVFRM